MPRGYRNLMWLYMVVAALVVLGIVGGVAGAGIFTIVLIPIALIVLLGGLAYRGMGQASSSGGPTSGQSSSLPTSSPDDPARVQASPEQLVDARRREQ